MTQSIGADHWQVRDRFLELRSRWMTLIGEHWSDHQGTPLEYWRVEKADSAIVLPLYDQHLWLPPPSYRPGIGTTTLDFPGGRVPADQDPEIAAHTIVARELGLKDGDIAHLSPLNLQGWAINSSFSNQKLYGFVAELQVSPQGSEGWGGIAYPMTETGMRSLLQVLTCLQCRALLLEWWLRSNL